MNRCDSPQAVTELSRHLSSLFSEAQCQELNKSQFVQAWGAINGQRLDKQVQWNNAAQTLLAPVVDPGTGCATGGVSMKFRRKIDESDLRVAKLLTQVFNGDIAIASDIDVHKELWLTLQQTRFSRAIGRFSSLSTDMVVQWLRSIENATSLRYEGNTFATQLVLARTKSDVQANNFIEIMPFENAIPRADALFSSKWVRTLSYGGNIGLIGTSKKRGIIGIFQPKSGMIAPTKKGCPHSRLANLCASVDFSALVMVASEAGDLFVVCQNGVTFLKRQGHWHYINYMAITAVLERHLSSDIASVLLQVILDQSFEKKGALFFVHDGLKDIGDVVTDYDKPRRPNEELRDFCINLTLDRPSHIDIIRSISTIDGAIVMDKDGAVIDCAAMVAKPAMAALTAKGISTYGSFPGARSTAAWNASLYGLGIKISEDGPITIFEYGKKVLEIG